MTKEEILQIAKKVITEEIERAGFKVQRIILFGSRAKGDERQDSDWDFYVVINKKIDFKTKKFLVGSILMKLAEFNIFCDILINDEIGYNRLKKEKSTISYLASKEGIRIC